jgi:hypothetical protein
LRADLCEWIHYGILGCQCCIFAIVDGIPIMHLDGSSTRARAHVEAGRPDLARRAIFNLDDEAHAARFDEVASADVSMSVGGPCHCGQ